MTGIVNVEKLNSIRDNYPGTWAWMQSKASEEHVCMGAVLNHYADYIDWLIVEEEKK